MGEDVQVMAGVAEASGQAPEMVEPPLSVEEQLARMTQRFEEADGILRAALVERTRLISERNAFREAMVQATMDADLLAVIVRCFDAQNGQLMQVSELHMWDALWVEIKGAMERAVQRSTIEIPEEAG